MGLQGLGAGALLAFALTTLAIFATAACISSLVYIFSSKSGRAERATQALRLSAKSFVFAVVIACLVDYASDVRLRSLAHECERQQSDDGRYLAELCLLRDDGHNGIYVGRVYSAKNSELLIERTFNSAETNLSWFRGQVSFMNGGDDSDVITLPPTWLDRILAKLP